MENQGTPKFTRLIVTVPQAIAESFGSALVELGAGAVEERPSSRVDSVEIVLTRPFDESLEPWRNAARCVYDVFIEELGVTMDGFAITTETCDIDYHAAWLEHLSLVALTTDLVFAPINDPTPTPLGARRLRFTPHPSFGDGSHPTTRLAAQAIETYCKAHRGCRILDVGTGNGVLSLVAAACEGEALGIDIDESAVAAAEDNARTNGLTNRCRFSNQALSDITERFELVVANVEPLTQLELAEELLNTVAPGKTLLLTGFLEEQATRILEPFLTKDFSLIEQRSSGDFVLLELLAPQTGND
jgi:ribosomal protein L11 methyltransferase